jgi:hypothetical protein
MINQQQGVFIHTYSLNIDTYSYMHCYRRVVQYLYRETFINMNTHSLFILSRDAYIFKKLSAYILENSIVPNLQNCLDPERPHFHYLQTMFRHYIPICLHFSQNRLITIVWMKSYLILGKSFYYLSTGISR